MKLALLPGDTGISEPYPTQSTFTPFILIPVIAISKESILPMKISTVGDTVVDVDVVEVLVDVDVLVVVVVGGSVVVVVVLVGAAVVLVVVVLVSPGGNGTVVVLVVELVVVVGASVVVVLVGAAVVEVVLVDVEVVEVVVDVVEVVVDVVEVVVVVGQTASSWNTPVVDGGHDPAPLLFAVILLKSTIKSTQTALLVVPS